MLCGSEAHLKSSSEEMDELTIGKRHGDVRQASFRGLLFSIILKSVF